MSEIQTNQENSVWDACSNELADLRHECAQLDALFESLWDELEQGVARLEDKQQQFTAIFSELLSLQEERKKGL